MRGTETTGELASEVWAGRRGGETRDDPNSLLRLHRCARHDLVQGSHSKDATHRAESILPAAVECTTSCTTRESRK